MINYDDPEVLARFGTVPDADLARALAVHPSAVWAARAVRGIPPHARNPEIAHADAILSVLSRGPLSGRGLAAQIGRDAKIVSTSLRLLEAAELVERSHPGAHPGVGNTWALAGQPRPVLTPSERRPPGRPSAGGERWHVALRVRPEERRAIEARAAEAGESVGDLLVRLALL